MPVIDVHNHLGVELGAYFRGEFPYAQSLFDLLEAANRNGVSHLVVFPMVTHLAQGYFANSDEIVPYAFENRRMFEEIFGLFEEHSKRVFPFAMFNPERNVEAQICELRSLKSKFPIYGLKTQPTIIQSKITALNGIGRPFLELASEWNVPVLIHSSVLPSDIWSQVHDIIDIAEKWPYVRFNVAHSCRFDVEGLKRIVALPNCWFDVSAHGIHCELATQNSPIVAPQNRRFQSDYTRPEIVLSDLTHSFGGKVLWGSDSPYHSFCARVEGEKLALMSSFERETSFLMALPEELREEIAYINPMRWLGVANV